MGLQTRHVKRRGGRDLRRYAASVTPASMRRISVAVSARL